MNFDLLLKYVPLVMAIITLVGLIYEIRKRKQEIQNININKSRINTVRTGNIIDNVNITIGNKLSDEQIQALAKGLEKGTKNG